VNTPKDRLLFDNPYELVEWIARAIRHYEANIVTSERLKEAHDYVEKYCMPDGWGKNVWHSILDDAIKLRKELNNK
jgi:hypothetical protein